MNQIQPSVKPPTAFVSYSWDSEKHREWVRLLAERLVRAGVVVHLDQWHVQPGESFTHFMERSVTESDFVIAVLTPAYARKSNQRKGGVGYEQQIVSGQIAAGIPRSKFIPVLRSGVYEPGPRCAIPYHFAGIATIDFRKDRQFAESLQLLLRALHSAPSHVAPELGAPPAFVRDHGQSETGSLPGSGQREGDGSRAMAGSKEAGSGPWTDLQPFYFESFDFADSLHEDPELVKQKLSPVWWPDTDDVWSVAVTGGVYRMVNTTDPRAVRYKFLHAKDRDLSEVPASVEVKAESGGGLFSEAGLMYRFDQDVRSYHAFVLSEQDRFTFYRRKDGVFVPLYSGRSTVILPGTFNKLGILSSGDRFDLFINDVSVKRVLDSTLASGGVGLIAMGKGTFYFDNLAIYQL